MPIDAKVPRVAPTSTAVSVCLMLGLLAVVTARNEASQAANETQVIKAGRETLRVTRVAGSLYSVWDFAFLPGGRDILFTQRAGRIRIIRNGILDPDPVWEMSPEPLDKDFFGKESADRLHMIALHPRFEQNRLVYLSYVKWDATKGNTMAIARGRFTGKTLEDVKDIFVADAWAVGPNPTEGNLGGGLIFGPDDTLYMTIGDRDLLYRTEDTSQRMKVQDLGSHAGKVIRIRDDGSVPPDNPFVNVPGAKPEIFTRGHRSGYGLAFHPTTGVLWQADIQAMGGDELNTLVPGHNYGWPLVSLGTHYSGKLVSEQSWWRPGMDMPQVWWNPSVSPSSIAFYTGDLFPRWKGNLFVGTLTTQRLLRIPFTNNQPGRQEVLLSELGARIRDVAQAPDGSLYIATESRYQDATPSAAIYRIEPSGQ